MTEWREVRKASSVIENYYIGRKNDSQGPNIPKEESVVRNRKITRIRKQKKRLVLFQAAGGNRNRDSKRSIFCRSIRVVRASGPSHRGGREK